MQTIDNNTKAFFALVKAGLWEQDVRLSDYKTIDFRVVFDLAQEQSVVGLVTAGLEHVSDIQVPKEVILSFVGATLQLEQRNKEMNLFIADLIKIMREADIYTLLLKGQGVAQCYERPLWRACGDVDLFLSDSNYDKAKNLLYPIAQSVEEEFAYTKHQEMTISSWSVEIHGNLRGRILSRVDRQLDAIQRDTFYGGRVRSWKNGNTQVFLLDANNDAAYIFSHILQHYFKWGIGLRQICDWCRLLWTYRESLDVSVLQDKIQRMGLMTEWKAFASFAMEYLGMPKDAMPFYSPKDKWQHKSKRIMRIVLQSGNMGHNRDMSYIYNYSFLVRKAISLWQHTKDGIKQLFVFPLDTVLIWANMFVNGLKVAICGDK